MEKKELTFEQTKEKALRLLEFRSHSENELEKKLKNAGGTGIDEVLDFCREYNFLNDREYAKKLSKDLSHLKKYGKRRIKDELKSRGIDDEYIGEALYELDVDEEESLLPLLKKKLANNFDKKNEDKAIRYFLYRGYEFSDIKRCLEVLKENNEYGI